MQIQIYDKSTIAEMECQDDKDNLFPETYPLPFVKNGTLNYIDNTNLEIQILAFEDNFFL